MSTSLHIPTALYEQIRQMAQQMDNTPEQVAQLALEQFVANHQPPSVPPALPITQGAIYWVQLPTLPDQNPAIPHPHVVLQPTLLNQTRIPTVVVCGLTTNLKRATWPGNILLEAGEANLPKPSLIEVSKVSAVAKSQLGAYIGTLSAARLEQIWAGMRFLQQSFFSHE